ncbi:MAG TPA: LuxR C-terminal-related transcriptional regulator [Chryseosolibacter sp.]
MLKFINTHRSIIFYSVCLAAMLVLLNWLKLRFIIIDHAFELYIGAIALLFTVVGIWVGLKVTSPKTVVVNQVVIDNKPFALNEAAITERNISRRELEVLQLMAEGLSNQEIADRLFLSLSTVKSHSNNLFDKLGVQRRTQAVDMGRKLAIIP